MSMMTWFDLVNASGIDAKKLDPMTVHELAGKILRDSVVAKRREKFVVNGILPTGSAQRAVREMTENERQLLRLRVKQH